MKVVLYLCGIYACSLANIVRPIRNYYLEEENEDYKRFIPVQSHEGLIDIIDLKNASTRASVGPEHITYYLYTNNNQDDPYIMNNDVITKLSISPHFDKTRPNLFLIHGWMDSYKGDLNNHIKSAVFKKFNLNVFVVDWSPISYTSYLTAKDAVPNIGKYIGESINEIIDTFDLDKSQFTLVGHSLGAHIAGVTGKTSKEHLHHIIGLDPAGPLFSLKNTDNRLDKSDAQYVQVIHTNGRLLGFSSSIGHADYYPNGGGVQAGCGLDIIGTCSHFRAYELLAEAIESDTPFTGTLCGSYTNYQDGKCENNAKSVMGSIEVDETVTGDYYLSTNKESPFALG